MLLIHVLVTRFLWPIDSQTNSVPLHTPYEEDMIANHSYLRTELTCILSRCEIYARIAHNFCDTGTVQCSYYQPSYMYDLIK